MTALLIGAALAVLALGFVLAPLVRRRGESARPVHRGLPPAHATPIVAVSLAPEALDDAAEALVRRMRDTRARCDRCGPRPEAASTFCSACGRHLAGCPHCGVPTQLSNARFCSACGLTLGA